MAQTVKLKRSAVAAKVPLTTDLALGELAVNTNDGVLYTLMNDGTNKIIQLGGQSISATVTAGTNAQGQGPLTSNLNVVTTTTANPSGVTLPTALLGRKLYIFNRGTNPINVYPATGGQIDSRGTNISIQIPVSNGMEFNATSTTQWYSSLNVFYLTGTNIFSSISGTGGTSTNSFFAGSNAGLGTTSGSCNTFIGIDSGRCNTTGCLNVYIGPSTGCLNTVGTRNNFIGSAAGASSTAGSYNNFIGADAGRVNTGSYNNFFGNSAGFANTSGSNNIFVGSGAGATNTTGVSNFFAGRYSGSCNITAGGSIAIGLCAGYANNGCRNTFLGECAGWLTGRIGLSLTGTDNVGIGKNTGASLTTGGYNNFIGRGTGCRTVGGSNNNFIGAYAGGCNTTGCKNNYIGFFSGFQNPSGVSNNFIGVSAGYSSSGGSYNNFLGAEAGRYNTGSYNNFFGNFAGYCNTTGVHNVFVGNSGPFNTTGSHNFFGGWNAGACNTIGSSSIIIGKCAGYGNNGDRNIFLGENSGWIAGRVGTVTGTDNIVAGCAAAARMTVAGNNVILGCRAGGGAVLTGSSNVLLGRSTGFALTSGRYNNFFGYYAGCGSSTGSYNNFFGYLAGQYSNTTNGFFAGRQAGYCTTGADNIFIGNLTGTDNTTGTCNIAIGPLAGRLITTGCDNIYIGNAAGRLSTISSTTVAIGRNAGWWNTGASNVFIGDCSGRSATRTACTSGGNNTAVGTQSGLNITTGAQNTFLGTLSGNLFTTGSCNVVVGGFSGTSFETVNNHIFLSDGAGTNRLMINGSGAIGVNGANYGTSGQLLTSGGNAAAPTWTSVGALTDGDKGDITVSGTGTVWTIDAGVITDTKVSATAAIAGTKISPAFGAQNVSTAGGTITARQGATQDGMALLGRAGGTGNFTMSLTPAAALSADVTISFPSTTATVAILGGQQTFSALKNFSATAVFYDTTATQDGVIITGRAGGTGTFRSTIIPGTLTASRTLTLPDVTGTVVTTGDTNTVTNAMLSQIATARFKGRVTAATGNVEDLTGTQATTLLDTFTSTLKGLAPASGGGTTNFLRADGTWAAPPGGGSLSMFTAAESTAAPNATVPVASLTATNAGFADIDVAYVAKGQGATLAQIPDSGLGGGNKRGTFATDWQKSRTAATHVASGAYSVLVGGRNNTASGAEAFLGGGTGNAASSQYATCVGGISNNANGFASTVVGGRNGIARALTGYMAFPACSNPVSTAQGTSQGGLLILGTQTTDATATLLRSDTNAASTTNQLTLPNNSAYYVRGSVIANVTAGGNTKAWTFEGAIKRGATAAATSIVGTFSTNIIAADAGASTWTIALSADTTNGALQVQVTGQAATTIRWVCKLETTEVTF